MTQEFSTQVSNLRATGPSVYPLPGWKVTPVTVPPEFEEIYQGTASLSAVFVDGPAGQETPPEVTAVADRMSEEQHEEQGNPGNGRAVEVWNGALTPCERKKLREQITSTEITDLWIDEAEEVLAATPIDSAAWTGRPEKTEAEKDWDKRRPQVNDVLDEVFAEVKRALDKHGGFRTGHEGYSVILEQLDDLWDEIKANRSGGYDAREKVIKVAAMAVKYAVYIAADPSYR